MNRLIRDKIEYWMNLERIGIIPHLILSLLSFVYSFAIRVRIILYRTNMLKSTAVRCPVISIGNLTVGGTGKTPVTMALTDLLRRAGIRPVIISRGYGRKGTALAVVSDGTKLLSAPAESGDEPYLMATRLKSVPVIVSSDRVKAAEYAIDNFRPDCLILDDGFQHIRLKRDINIILIDGDRGFGNGYLLPRGILREPLSRLADADIALVKGGRLNKADSSMLGPMMLPLMGFDYEATTFIDLANDTNLSIDEFKAAFSEQETLALCGIANPDSFIATLRSIGVSVTSKAFFPDHHDYTHDEIEAMKKSGTDVIVTTEKDGVKLKRHAHLLNVPVLALRVEAVFRDPEQLMDCIIPILKRKH